MASLAKSDLTAPKKLGKYSETSSSRGGGTKPKHQSRSLVAEESNLARECSGCSKDIKKGKIALMCACKWAIFCSQHCQRSSTHRCHGKAPLNRTATNTILACQHRYYRDQAAGRGPSSDGIKKLMKKIKGDEGRLLSMAEDGDPLAAFIIGSAYWERRNKEEMGSNPWAYSIPPSFLEKSVLETTEIAISWLKVAAEGEVPEAMFLLYLALISDCGLEVDKRVGLNWLDAAYRTGKMNYLIQILEHGGNGLAFEFAYLPDLVYGIESQPSVALSGPSLRQLLMAARWPEIKNWGGKTAMGEPFYGWVHFRKFMDDVGGLQMIKQAEPSIASSKEKSLEFLFISGRPGSHDALIRSIVSKERKESNIKFKQGVKAEVNPDFQLIRQGLFAVEGRTSYLVTCKHNEVQGLENAEQFEGARGSNLGKKDVNMARKIQNPDWSKCKYKRAGRCQPCVQDALQRLHSVDQGRYSISITEVIPNHSYGARYVDENGVIVQDVFKAYSKSDLRQVLQCLMTNPADLHPLAVAEDQTLYWGIIWYWGSVYHAVKDTCDKNTLTKIYGSLAGNMDGDREANSGFNAACEDCRSANVSGVAAFPESAAGEWRIACGSQVCPIVDHQVKFNLCRGCKVRRYCNEVCQREDWPKHKKFCKAPK